MKRFVGIGLLIIFLWCAGFHMPFVANIVHGKITSGMSKAEVTAILSKYKGRSFIDAENDAKMSVLFMGPAFLHNIFEVYFDPQGNVESVTSVKRLD